MIKKIINIVLIAMLVVLTVLQVYMINTFKDIPSRVEFTFMEENVQQGDFLYNTVSNNQDFLISYSKNMDILLEGNRASLILTDENYPSFESFNLIKGKWFSSNENQAVISNGLSMDLFGTLDVVGKIVNLEGDSYTISGVYEEIQLNKKILGNRKILYVPLNSSLDHDNITISRLLVNDRNGKVQHFLAEKFIDQFSLPRMSVDHPGYSVKDMTKTVDVISQFFTGYIFFIEILLFILICSMSIRKFNTIVKKFKSAIKKQYLGEIISDNMTNILIEGIKWAVMILVGIFLLREIISYQFYVPGKYLPPDYIFDLQFYSNLLSQRSDITSGLVSNYEELYRTVFSYCLVILVVKIVLSLGLYLVVLKRLSTKENQSVEHREINFVEQLTR